MKTLRGGIIRKSYDIFEKLDYRIDSIVKSYEKEKLGLKELRNNLHNTIELFDIFNFEIIDKNNKFILDYIIKVDKENILNINIEFFNRGDFIYYKYNFVYIVSTYGEIISDSTINFIKVSNGE